MNTIHTFYVNLDNRADRKELVEQELAKIDCTFERFPAILHPNGAVGVGLSQIACLKLAKERNLPQIMIVEDDISWVGDVNSALENLKEQEFDVALLSSVFEGISNPVRVNDIFVRSARVQTAAAYICKQHYYDTLIRNFEEAIQLLQGGKVHPDKCAIDQHWKVLQEKDRWLYAHPTIAVQRPGYSDIQKAYADYTTAYRRRR